jgi:hypothetical protein
MKPDGMRLQSLSVYARHGNEGYSMTAKFAGLHNVELRVPGDLGDKIIRTCMDEIVAQIKAAAESVTAESLLRGQTTAAKEIEHQGDAPWTT